jgi:hypothetical protein
MSNLRSKDCYELICNSKTTSTNLHCILSCTLNVYRNSGNAFLCAVHLNEIQFYSKISTDSWQQRTPPIQEASFFPNIKLKITRDTAVTTHCIDIITSRERAHCHCISGSQGIVRRHRRRIK